MLEHALLSIIAAFMLFVGQVAVAEAAGPAPHPDRHLGSQRYNRPPMGEPPSKEYSPQRRPPVYYPSPAPHGYNRYKSSHFWRAQHGNFRPRHALPPYYLKNHHHYVVHDWRGPALYEPPHGYHWLLIDGNFILAAISTGIIAHILLGH